MSELSVIVSGDGGITLPESVRDQIGLAEGARLVISVDGRKIVLEPQPEIDWRTWEGRYRGSDLSGALEREHRNEIDRDDENALNAKSS